MGRAGLELVPRGIPGRCHSDLSGGFWEDPAGTAACIYLVQGSPSMKAFPQENTAWAWPLPPALHSCGLEGCVRTPGGGGAAEGAVPGLWEQRAPRCRSGSTLGVLTRCQHPRLHCSHCCGLRLGSDLWCSWLEEQSPVSLFLLTPSS